MTPFEAIEETIHRLRAGLAGGGAERRMPTLDEAAYRIRAMLEGDPVSGRGPGIGVPTPRAEDYLAGALDAVTPIPAGLGTMAIRAPETTLPLQVSTRFPTAPGRTEDPMTHDLIVSYGSQQMDPGQFAKNVDFVLGYPNVRPGATIEDYIERARANLNFLYENVEPSIREQTRQWYVGGRALSDEAAMRYGTTPEAAAGIYATQSPQKDWYQNVSLGDRIMDAMANLQGFPWTPQMDAVLDTSKLSKSVEPLREQIRGKSLQELTDSKQKALWIRTHDLAHRSRAFPQVTPLGDRGELVMTESAGRPTPVVWQSIPTIAKAVRIYENPILENISKNLGEKHKVRSFYNNLIQPWSQRGDVTMDTHAVAAAHLSPLGASEAPVLHNLATSKPGVPGAASSGVTGQQGTYGIHGEAYERAAQDVGVLPREMQSITWEAVRGLFENKSPRMKAAAADIWSDYARGLTSQGQAQRKIMELFGGISPPTWY